MKITNITSRRRRKVKAKLYHGQGGRCAECRRSLTIEQSRLTRIDNSTQSCSQKNLRLVCELCLYVIDQRRIKEGDERARRRQQEALPSA